MQKNIFLFFYFLVLASSAFADEYLACDVTNIWTHSPEVSKRLKSSDVSFYVVKHSDDKSVLVTMIQQGKEISTEKLHRAKNGSFNGKPTIQFESTNDRGVAFSQFMNSNLAMISVHEPSLDLRFIFTVECKK
jgi:hypothetical protein